MSKFTKAIAAIMLTMAVVCAAGCNKNKENQGVAQFTATIEQSEGRTLLNPDNGQINWTAGDQIVISNADNETAIFNLQSGDGTTEGGFGTSDEFNTVGPFIAAYPSTAEIEADKVTFNLPATQSIGETGIFGNGANPMVAYSDDKNLQFKNLCGGLGIRLKGLGAHVTAVRIISKNTSEKLWGAYEVSNCAANEPTLTVASGNQGTNVITLNCNVTLTTAAKTFFVMLPPGTLANGFTMEVLDGNEVLATKETDSDVALVERNTMKVFNEILIDVEFDGNVEIPTGMDPSNIIVTNFGEDAIPDENGDFAIGYSKMLVAKNAVNNEPIYFAVNSTDFSIQKGVLENGNYELSAKETAIYFALNNFPNGLSEASDEKFNALKDLLYSLDCVQQLEQTILNVVNQYGYLNPDALTNSIETVRNFFYNQLIVPIIGDAQNNKEILLNPPHADPDHFGQLAKIEFLNEQYNDNSDSWDVLCKCWNGFAIWVGVIEGTIVGDDAVSFNPESIVDYIRPTTATDALSIESYLDWNQYVQKFKDLYGTISEYFNNHQQYFQKAGKSSRDVWFNLNNTEDAICYVGPEFKQVVTANCVGLALETVKFVLGQLIGPSFSADVNFAMFVAEAEMDEEYIRLLNVWSYTHDKEDFKAILRRMVHNMGVGLLNHGIFDVEELAAYNEYTAMYSAFAYATDLALAIVEYAHFNSFYFEVGGEHSGPSIIPIGVTDVTSNSATVSAFVKSEGARPVVERGFEWTCTTPSGEIIGGDVVAGSGSGIFSYQFENLYPNTEYFGLIWARQELGGQKYYAEGYYEFTTLPEGGGQIPTDGLVAYYPFNGNANDESGNGHNGEIIGNVTLSEDRKGDANGAYRFYGEPYNYISISDDEDFHLSTFTLNAWVFSDAENYGSGHLINKGRDIINGSYRLQVNGVNAQNEYSGENGAWAENNPAVHEWHMITGTVQGDQAKIYIDGVLMGERTLSHPFVYSNSEPLTLGMHYYGGVPSYWAYPLLGVLDDVRIYNRVLTPSEIQALYNE